MDAIGGHQGNTSGNQQMMPKKRRANDTLLQARLRLRSPPRIAAGQTIASLVQLHAPYPTILGLAGVAPPAGVPVEAVPLPGTGLAGAGRPEDAPIIGEFVGPPVEFIKIMQDLFPERDLSRYNRTLIALRQGDQSPRSEEHTSELQSRPHLVCRLLLEKKK